MIAGILVVILVMLLYAAIRHTARKSAAPAEPAGCVPVSPGRCPGCGSPVRQRGTGWECPWCGNSGLCGYVTLPADSSGDDLALENALADWADITDAVEVLCPAAEARRTWAECFAAYAVSDALVRCGSLAARRPLLLRFWRETGISVPAALEPLTEPLFSRECQVTAAGFGTYWTEIFSALPADTAADDPPALLQLAAAMDSLFLCFGDGMRESGYAGRVDAFRDSAVVKNQR